MRTFKRLFFLLLLLAVTALIAAQWWMRSSAGVSSVERRIKASTGLEAVVDSVRLGWGLDVVLTDVSLMLKDARQGDPVVFEAPAVTVSGHGRERMFFVSRPVFTAVQSQRGEWVPSQLRPFSDEGALLEALQKLADSMEVGFEITDAVLVMQDAGGREIVSYSGVNWYHAPARLKGRTQVMHNVFSLQCINGGPPAISAEWLSDATGVYFLVPPVDGDAVCSRVGGDKPALGGAAGPDGDEKGVPVAVGEETRMEDSQGE